MSQKTANGGDAAEDIAALKARIAELETANKELAEKLAEADNAIEGLGKRLAEADEAAKILIGRIGELETVTNEKAMTELPERKPSREFSKDELALAKKLAVPAGYIHTVNLKSGVIVTVDGRKLRAGGA